MKHFLLSLALTLAISSCSNKKSGTTLSSSNGKVNEVKAVVAKELWEGQIGDALREVLATPVDGLPQEEPLFSISQIPPDAFKGFLKKNRIFIRVTKDSMPSIAIEKDVYARPQTGITVKGRDSTEISNLIVENSEKIIAAFRAQELEATQRRIRKALKKHRFIFLKHLFKQPWNF
mgnify:CR=1 FL=1